MHEYKIRAQGLEEEAGYLLQQAGTEFSYGDYEGYDTYKEEAGKKLDEAQNCGENADEYESRARYYYELDK